MKFVEITLHRRCTSVRFSIQRTRTPACNGRPRYVGGWSVGQSVVSNFTRYSGAQVHLGDAHSKQWAALNASSLWAYLVDALDNTQRGRSRAQHVRDRKADVKGAKNLGLVHLRRSKRLCFRAKAPKETNGEARRAVPIGWGSFVAERRSSSEARRAKPTSPFSWCLI